MHSIDVITLSGWGELLCAFLPTSGWLALWDVIFFIVLPLLGVLVTIAFARRVAKKPGIQGAWRSAGACWCRCLAISLVILAFCWIGEKAVLESNFGGHVTFVQQYSDWLLVSAKGSDELVKNSADPVLVIANNFRNKDVVTVTTEKNSAEYEIVAFFCDWYSCIHHLIYLFVDILILLWLFGPGFKMRRETIEF